MRKFFSLLLLFSTFCFPGFAAEEDFSYTEIVLEPYVTVLSPAAGTTYEAGGTLTVSAVGRNTASMEATLSYEGETESFASDGDLLSYVFNTANFTKGAVLTVTGYGKADDDGHQRTYTRTVHILSPREKLIADMFSEAFRNFHDSNYYHAPAQEDGDRGVCKNFVMRLFDTFKDDYAMLEYPDLSLHMPLNNSKANCAPYDYGIEWRVETAADGSPFEIAAQFKYNTDLSKEENEALCLRVLESVQSGDFFQMVGYYYYGNGPHSLLFMRDYDSITGEMHWTDSNMKGNRVNGVRWGYMQYDAVNTAQWFVEAICTRNRGCTLYRLREDLFIK